MPNIPWSHWLAGTWFGAFFAPPPSSTAQNYLALFLNHPYLSLSSLCYLWLLGYWFSGASGDLDRKSDIPPATHLAYLIQSRHQFKRSHPRIHNSIGFPRCIHKIMIRCPQGSEWYNARMKCKSWFWLRFLIEIHGDLFQYWRVSAAAYQQEPRYIAHLYDINNFCTFFNDKNLSLLV